ncbi:hypothetical protein DCE93_11720 [Agromyces badenianii]|uniref:Uncharacterized protein n=1 Tax=Agromyces badenianii TaxID=2080742 RepID=A0A2S0WY03_9MICO|nr:DUF6412 domain-containing protein [Agromyces badenianii]AWB96237.1 hypothetical protein DCE93_11720 [Agromyces badenianii]PWC05096.1 hypothetical protein DCE94_01935 [Agromyces badenianii]
MLELLVALFRVAQASLEIALASNGQMSVVLVGVVGAAALAVVVVACQAVPAIVAADASGAATRFRQTADPWRLLAQSDPDAPGRARPRAPACGLPAA